MKKVLTYVLSLVAVAALAISGTLAYLTDQTETKTNVFTVGNVDIDLTENVAVVGEGGTVKTDETGAQYSTVMPGDYLLKEVTVTNEGNPAYVAITVTLNNARQINKAIDDAYEAKGYTAEQIQEIYDFIFDGWGLNYSKDLDGDGQSDAGMRLTITGDDMPEHVLHVDSVKTLTDYAQYYNGNWFGEKTIKYPSANDVYKKDMGKYEIKYTYYAYLENGESTTLFKGLNVPAEFDSKQLEMFAGLEIDVKAAAIQAENMGVAAEFQGQDNAEAKTAFAILAGKVDEADLGVNNKPIVVDNTADLKAAIKTKNSIIAVKPGTYDMGGEFSVAEGTTIVGGEGVVIKGTLTSTVKNITVKGVTFTSNNAQRWAYAKGNVVFEDCTFEGKGIYAIHYDDTTGADIVYKDCKIVGWVAIAGTPNSLTFDGCEIYGNGTYGVIRSYGDATIKDCTFDVDNVNTTDAYQDGIHAVDCEITVINSTNVNGNIEDLFNTSGSGVITLK